MSYIKAEPKDLPPNLPTVNLEDIGGDGWERPAMGQVIRTYWQAYAFAPKIGWQMSAFYTAEGYTHNGTSNYRVPTKLKTWLIILFPLICKILAGIKSGRIWKKKR